MHSRKSASLLKVSVSARPANSVTAHNAGVVCFQVYGDGEQTRSFQYVTDLVDGLIKLMDSNYSLPVNLGNPEEHTILQFADIIKTLAGT